MSDAAVDFVICEVHSLRSRVEDLNDEIKSLKEQRTTLVQIKNEYQEELNELRRVIREAGGDE